MAFAQKSVAEMGAQKSGAAGDQNAHLLRPRILQESSSGAELLLLLGFGCEFLKLRCRTAHADVHQSVSLHLFTAVEVSSIHYDWITQQLMQPLQSRPANSSQSVRISRASAPSAAS